MAPPETQPLASRGVGIRLTAVLGVLSLFVGLLLTLVRPWYKTWGADPHETYAALPIQYASASAPHETRAIDINAPAAEVFAWVAQLGQDRAGFYSYELLEDLVGCNMPDLRYLDPELQEWNVGDLLWMYPPSKLEGLGHATLVHYEPGRALVFATHSSLDDRESPFASTWSFFVAPTGPDSSRLITRASGEPPGLLGLAFNRTVFEPLHFAMERRMLIGIKALAEGRPIATWRDNLQLLSWLASFLSLCASTVLVLIGSAWQRRLLGLAASAVVFQIVTLLQPSPVLSLALVLPLSPLLWPKHLRTPPATTTIAEQPS
jgi:hypothetical protein